MDPLLHSLSGFFFWFLSALMLLGGLGVLLNRNPVASALSLVITILGMAGLFVLLHAFFLAGIEIIVYAGAVMVLFLFIIMLLDLKAEGGRRVKLFGLSAGLAVGVFFAFQFFRVLHALPEGHKTLGSLPVPQADDVPAIGALFFSKYVLPFEATGVLLLVAMIGVVLLSKKELK
jgi:NADH-quinone oxidoreductase subunit J